MRSALRAMTGTSTFPPRSTAGARCRPRRPPRRCPRRCRRPSARRPARCRPSIRYCRPWPRTPADAAPQEQARPGNRWRGCRRGGRGRRLLRGVRQATERRGDRPAVARRHGPRRRGGPAAAGAEPAAHETPPPPPTQILVRLTSEPAGALVTDTQRGVVIGATPFEQRLERKQTTLGVRLAKDGFANVDLPNPAGRRLREGGAPRAAEDARAGPGGVCPVDSQEDNRIRRRARERRRPPPPPRPRPRRRRRPLPAAKAQGRRKVVRRRAASLAPALLVVALLSGVASAISAAARPTPASTTLHRRSRRRILRRVSPVHYPPKTIVRLPDSSTRRSRCRRTARVSTRRSSSLPLRTSSSTSSRWLTRQTS